MRRATPFVFGLSKVAPPIGCEINTVKFSIVKFPQFLPIDYKLGIQIEENTVSTYSRDIDASASLVTAQGSSWDAISPEYVARMKAQNRFKTGLDIARYTADIMRDRYGPIRRRPGASTRSLSVAGTALLASKK